MEGLIPLKRVLNFHLREESSTHDSKAFRWEKMNRGLHKFLQPKLWLINNGDKTENKRKGHWLERVSGEFFRAVMVMKKKGKHEPFGNSIASGLGTD